MEIFGKLLLVFSLLLFTSFGTAWAQTTTDSAKVLSPFEKIRETLLQKRTVVQERRATTAAKRQERRDELKVKACQAKEKVLDNRINSLTRLVTNVEEKFSNIVERVKKHYTDKVLPKGLTVANYDALLTDIDSKKVAVDSALASAKTNADAFTCDSDDPKAVLTQFRSDMQAVKDALKDYKTSIRNLIVAVKSVTGQENASPGAATQ